LLVFALELFIVRLHRLFHYRLRITDYGSRVHNDN
jgi:hypothetical protein